MKEDIVVSLREWTLHYLQNKDLLTHQIVSIDAQRDGWDLLVTTKTEPRYVLILPALAPISSMLEKFAGKNVLLITLNKRENLDILTSTWPELIKYPTLMIMFVNPYSNLEKKWVLMPHVHEKVTERKALKLGLISLFQTVEEFAG